VARLPRRAPAPAVRGREVRLGLVAVLGLLLVVVGVPIALVLALGNPLPTSAPSADWLQTQVSATVVINAIGIVLWLAWAHFVVCILTEWSAARRGSGLPGDVPLGGGSQLLARRLVAATLLLAGAASFAPSPEMASGPARPVTSMSSVELNATPPVPEAAPAAEAPAAVQEVTKTYQVAPPDGRRYDSLWDIAERTLGDPFRYKEIFELNRDRAQPDGRTLVEADLIHPGWTLIMPADASGPGIHVATPPPVAPAPVPVQPDGGGAPVQEQPAGTETAGAAGGSGGSVQQGGISLQQGLLGGGLLAAGLLLALSGRRGPYSHPAEDTLEQELRLAADPERAELLDRLLRGLAADCAEQGTALPDVALAYLGQRELVLHLTTPSAIAPAPWVTSADDRVWTTSVPPGVVPEARPDVPAPYPALTNVATVGEHELLLDLEASPGVISVTGTGARDVVVSMAVELATNTWSDGVEVTLVGFGDDLVDVAPERIVSAARVADVLGELQSEATRSTAGLRASGAGDVLAGRLQRTADRRRPRVVVLSGPPSAEEALALSTLVRGGRTPIAVLVVGPVPTATWRFDVDAAGSIDLGIFGVSGRARSLSPQEYAPVLALLRDADASRRQNAADVSALTPRSAAQAVRELAAPGQASSPRGATLPLWALLPATPGVPAELTRPSPAAVHVELLGPVTVSAPGPLEEAARPLLTELVVAVALHRDGLHDALLRALVWPRGADDQVVAQTVAQAQAWLGESTPGRPRLALTDDGRYVLSDDVECDVDLLRTAAEQAEGVSELAVLRAGLDLVDGPAFTPATSGRYRWLRFHTAASEARVVGTAVARRAAVLAVSAGDREAAAGLLSRGLELVPDAEAVWRDLLRISPRDQLPELVDRLHDELQRRSVRPEPETDALVEQLLPTALDRAAGFDGHRA